RRGNIVSLIDPIEEQWITQLQLARVHIRPSAQVLPNHSRGYLRTSKVGCYLERIGLCCRNFIRRKRYFKLINHLITKTMNKTIIININSIVFHIEEVAKATLIGYIAEIKKHFGQTPDSDEIFQDIEMRSAEMLSERIHAGKKVVSAVLDVEEVIAQMGRVNVVEELDHETASATIE